MSVETYVQRAHERVDQEREQVAAKHAAYDRFADRVREIQPRQPSQTTTHAGVMTVNTAVGGETERQRVIEAFSATVEASLDTDESTLEALTGELGEDITTALVAAPQSGFAPTARQAILEETTRRRNELTAMTGALNAEERSLSSATESLQPITDWIIETNETSLLDLGFEELNARHGQLEEFCEVCDELVRRRQTHIRKATGTNAEVGMTHRNLIEYLYADFPTTHPVLVTTARLAETCRGCQRPIRDHLTRRV